MRDLWHSCLRKRQYTSKADAKRAVRQTRAVIGTHGLHVYRCDFGRHWHIGHDHLRTPMREEA